MKLKITLVMILILTVARLTAQVGIVQDAKGETSLVIKNYTIALNAQDESLSFSGGIRLKGKDACNKAVNWLGLSGKFNGKDAVSSILKENEFKLDGEFGLFFLQTFSFGECDPFGNTRILQWYGSVNFLAQQFTLFDSTAAYEKQIADKATYRSKVNFGINFYPGDLKIAKVNLGPTILGTSFNFGSSSNIDDLDAISISTFSTYSNTNGQVRAVHSEDKSAYKLSEYTNAVSFLNINTDVGFILKKRFPIILHSRYSANDQRKPQWNPGVGVYISQEGSPTDIVAGIQYQVLDFFDTQNEGTSRSNRGLINVVAGYIIK